MTARAVEWVLVIRYGISAHRATYGRLPGTSYTKDYIQLSKRAEFIDDLEAAFPALRTSSSSSITYEWPNGSAEGTIFKQSADRPHLAWETSKAPAPWRMLEDPSPASAETIRGNPSHNDEVFADREFRALASSGFGQPYLIAVKLKGDQNRLHLRVAVEHAAGEFRWADLTQAPPEIQAMAAITSNRSALAWRSFSGAGGTSELYFDPSSKTAPWSDVVADAGGPDDAATSSSQMVTASQAGELDSDIIAEGLKYSEQEVSEFQSRVEVGNYGVPDSLATAKTRGSAQRVFSREVKDNYGWRCAVTGLSSREFLIASHIVPWSADETIRLDPANGICLSVFVDCAFEKGFVIIEDDFTIGINWEKVGDDDKLRDLLSPLEGQKITLPRAHPPRVDYLRRRRRDH